MYFAGTAGNGIVVARLSDGSWSPPSAIAVRSGSVGIVAGVDVYDCICVLNTKAAVEAYQKSEMQLGGGLTLAAGPVGGTVKGQETSPVWTYTKSLGIYGGVTLDSTFIKQLPETNAEFYGARVTSAQILSGDVTEQEGVNKWPAGAKALRELLKGIDGNS